MVGTNPFSIQSKQQLNLKKDESIIEYSYCVSDNGKNHCIWMIDEKLQVWKCSNELNPNSCNWTLAKITMFESLFYKKFLMPSMTYDDFFMSTILNKLRCFQKIIQNGESHEFFFIYNGTSTKTIIVKQPAISYTGSDYLEVKDNQ